MYYIYIDTKIIGAVEQLAGYFQTQVFNSNDCIEVICKYYKEIETAFPKYFTSNEIPFRFLKKQSDYNLIEGKTVFYLFNAQSNCRLVANRNLVHIFVTHGESHKLSSIKPIIRIYDYIITSGKVGIDRYLKSGIFSPYDVESGRIITLGNTFLGSNDFSYDSGSDAIVYAPTWEGGVPSENYCSISDSTSEKIIVFCQKNSIKKVYIQPHPNLGHRDASYKEGLNLLVKKLKDNKLKVSLHFKNSKVKSFIRRLALTKLEYPNGWGKVRFSITDISAMEMQFVNKCIPCLVLVKKEFVSQLSIPKKVTSYCSKIFFYEHEELLYDPKTNEECNKLNDYFFSYPSINVEEASISDRIKWLCEHSTNHLNERKLHLKKEY